MRLYGALKVQTLVGTIAERLGFRVATAAERYCRAAAEAKRLPFLIDHLEITLYPQRAVIANCDFCGRHVSHLSLAYVDFEERFFDFASRLGNAENRASQQNPEFGTLRSEWRAPAKTIKHIPRHSPAANFSG